MISSMPVILNNYQVKSIIFSAISSMVIANLNTLQNTKNLNLANCYLNNLKVIFNPFEIALYQ